VDVGLVSLTSSASAKSFSLGASAWVEGNDDNSKSDSELDNDLDEEFKDSGLKTAQKKTHIRHRSKHISDDDMSLDSNESWNKRREKNSDSEDGNGGSSNGSSSSTSSMRGYFDEDDLDYEDTYYQELEQYTKSLREGRASRQNMHYYDDIDVGTKSQKNEEKSRSNGEIDKSTSKTGKGVSQKNDGSTQNKASLRDYRPKTPTPQMLQRKAKLKQSSISTGNLNKKKNDGDRNVDESVDYDSNDTNQKKSGTEDRNNGLNLLSRIRVKTIKKKKTKPKNTFQKNYPKPNHKQ